MTEFVPYHALLKCMYLRSHDIFQIVSYLQAAKKSAKKAKKEAMKTPEKSAEEPTPSKEKVSIA